jgi:hypothetical protein
MTPCQVKGAQPNSELVMARQVPLDIAKVRAHRRRRAADTRRWRSRQRRGVQLFQIEAGAPEYELALKYGGLREDQISDKMAVSAALGRLLRHALVALLREDRRRG